MVTVSALRIGATNTMYEIVLSRQEVLVSDIAPRGEAYCRV